MSNTNKGLKYDLDNLFLKLCDENESEYLDFKQEFHEDNTKLIHDILCLANSRHNGDKYILYGVNDEKVKIGLSGKPKTQNNVVTTLRDAWPNRSLHNDIKLHFIKMDNKKFAILIIHSRPDKPFFLLKDYPPQVNTRTKNGNPCVVDANGDDKKNLPNKAKACVRAGVIYTRHSDGNTPICQTASDDEMELMWRQRFGLDLRPVDRFNNYLDDIENWESIENRGNCEYYYKNFPEFRIIEEKHADLSSIPSTVPINDDWIPRRWKLTTPEIFRIYYSLRYHDLILCKIMVWFGDNGREPVPLPKIRHIERNIKNIVNADIDFSWFLSKKSIDYKAGKLIAKMHNCDLEKIIKETKIEVLD